MEHRNTPDICNRIILALLIVIGISLMSVACSDSPADSSFTQTQDDLSARLVINPYPPSVMQATTLELLLQDTNGNSVSGVDVQFDLTMPAMEMPENQPVVIEGEGGNYKAEALFTMGGEWQIDATVERAGETTLFTFMINLN